MKPKKNPLLAQYEAMLRAEYQNRLEASAEIDMIALMQTVHEELQVGPGRAKFLFDAFLCNKMSLVDAINEDWGPDKHTGDKELLHTKYTYTKLLKSIFSAEDWEQVKEFFPLLKEYW